MHFTLQNDLHQLRDYQQQMRDAVLERFKVGNRALAVAATGAGKSGTFAKICAEYNRSLVLVDQQDLVDQTVRSLLSFAGIYADVEQGERRARLNARAIVATVQSMRSRIKAGKYPPDHFDIIIADECDRAVAPQWQEVLSYFDKRAKVLGVTATPKRGDKRNILGYFEEKVFEIGTIELIERGWLSPITVRTVPLKIDLKDVAENVGDYDEAQLGHAIEGVFGAVCDAIKEHAGTRKILVFLPNIETSRRFAECAREAGIDARHIDSTCADRQEIKQWFRERQPGTLRVLCNPMMLGRGYDDPGIDCVINLRATKSDALYRQIVGRGTRLYCPECYYKTCGHPGRKKDLLVLDFLWQFKGLGPCRPASLIAETEEQARVMTEVSEGGEQLNLIELREEAKNRMEQALLKALAEAQRKPNVKKGEYFDAAQWAANLHLSDLVDYEPQNPREAQPVPERLMERLVRAGFMPETIKCRGHAEKIAAVLDARRQAKLATFKQVWWLRKLGVKNPEGIGFEEASEIMQRAFAKRRKPSNPRPQVPEELR